jgi:hypothetical protein
VVTDTPEVAAEAVVGATAEGVRGVVGAEVAGIGMEFFAGKVFGIRCKFEVGGKAAYAVENIKKKITAALIFSIIREKFQIVNILTVAPISLTSFERAPAWRRSGSSCGSRSYRR